MKVVEELESSYNYQKILDEYTAYHNGIPSNYVTTEVCNEGKYTFDLPYTKSVCEDVRRVFDFNFALFRQMPPRSTLSWHVDGDCEKFSYHIPIVTNQCAFFAISDGLYALHNCGKLYRVFTHDYHTFINCGLAPRIHLHFIRDNGGTYLKREFKG